MTSAPRFPPGWSTDPTLQPHIPAPHDYRTFGRLPENEDRYAACILGGGVYDIFDGRFLSPDSNGKNCRRRYRLNQGRLAKPIRLFYARLIARLAYGDPPGSKYEAHHVDGVNTHDTWHNIRWQTKPQNLAVEKERHAAKRRTGADNGRTQLTHDQLVWFIESCHEDTRRGRRTDLQHWAKVFSGQASLRHLQRILAGQSRSDEVEAIRARLKERDRIDWRTRRRTRGIVEPENPFFAVDSDPSFFK